MDRTINVGELFVDMSTSWGGIQGLKVSRVSTSIEARPSTDYFDKEEPIEFDTGSDIFVCPYQPSRVERYPSEAISAWLIADLASNYLRSKKRDSPEAVINEILSDPRCKEQSRHFVEGCLRCCVRRGMLEVWSDKRKRNQQYSLRLSQSQSKSEEIRLFAGSFADELSALSERIRRLVRHSGTVGTYREGLLKSLLRRHLPERYHVATGFVLGCPRQVDVLIYDRIDYAPIFREDDLVVVPPQSVRAVIEVKTTLTSSELESSLALISEVAQMDDVDPPFFKGVFAFGSDLAPSRIYEDIVTFHQSDEDEFDEDGEVQKHRFLIAEPYKHVTCVCVQSLAFAFVGYRNEGHDSIMTPTLMARSSVSGLPAQASYFLQMLLSYLHYQTLKPGSGRELQAMLGADTQTAIVSTLTDFAEWGPYFVLSEGVRNTGAEEVREAERTIANVERWLAGETFYRHPST